VAFSFALPPQCADLTGSMLALANTWSIIIGVKSVFLLSVSFVLLAGCFVFDKSFSSLPAPPSDLELANESMEMNLSWKDNSDNEEGFSIERKNNSPSDDFTEIATVAQNVTTYTDAGPFGSGSTYTYRVRAFNNVGYSGYSNEASFTYSAASLSLPSHSKL
jgi:hypothetical protein